MRMEHVDKRTFDVILRLNEFRIEEDWEVEQYETKHYYDAKSGEIIGHTRRYGVIETDEAYNCRILGEYIPANYQI